MRRDTLFYLDRNESAEIVYGGMGLNPNAFDENAVRISGKGFRPTQYQSVNNAEWDGSTTQTNLITSYMEDWALAPLSESNLRHSAQTEKYFFRIEPKCRPENPALYPWNSTRRYLTLPWKTLVSDIPYPLRLT